MVYATELFPPPARGSPDAEKDQKTIQTLSGKFIKPFATILGRFQESVDQSWESWAD